MSKDILGFIHYYDKGRDETVVSWSYEESDDDDYFVLETWNESKQKWEPYDGRLGIIEKEGRGKG